MSLIIAIREYTQGKAFASFRYLKYSTLGRGISFLNIERYIHSVLYERLNATANKLIVPSTR